jgi:hypothetical protein
MKHSREEKNMEEDEIIRDWLYKTPSQLHPEWSTNLVWNAEYEPTETQKKHSERYNIFRRLLKEMDKGKYEMV